MKECPTCKSLYPAGDDFCPVDGSVLVQPPFSSQNIPTQIVTPTPVAAGGRKTPSALIYVVAGVLGTIVVIGAGYLVFSGSGKTANEKFENVTGSPNGQTPSVTPNQDRAGTIVSPTPAPAAAVSPKGHWTGDWSSPSGAYLTIVVDLDDDGAGGISGRIEWTLRRTMRPEKMNKIGMSATEYVSGRFDPVTNTLTMKGYRKDDPNNVLVMVDSYRLVLTEDSRHLNGAARNGGKWNAIIKLSR